MMENKRYWLVGATNAKTGKEKEDWTDDFIEKKIWENRWEKPCNIKIGDKIAIKTLRRKGKIKGIYVKAIGEVTGIINNHTFNVDWNEINLWDFKPFYKVPAITEIKKQEEIHQIFKTNYTLGKEKVMNEYKELLEKKFQLILYGSPGTGKTRLAKQIANYIVSEETGEEEDGKVKITDNERIKLIQFHPSYNYEDFIRGIVAKTVGEKIAYETMDKILLKMANKAKQDKDNKYILIIDEINRANLSAVLGELIYGLEYRKEEIDCMYPDNKNNTKISIPKNLYIIGTMNTADRSVGTIDYAIRRRFAFAQVLSDENVLVNFKDGKKLFNYVKDIFVNNENEKEKSYERNYLSPEFNYYDVMIGHSYFMSNDKELQMKLEYEIKPILVEYINDGVLIDKGDEKVMDTVNNLSI
jgi:5-methylcytosine-specific restriction endonuclease McrBC GTP-binding regulatory subunit McrB